MLKISTCICKRDGMMSRGHTGHTKRSQTRVRRESLEYLERRDQCRRKGRPLMQHCMLSCTEELHRGTSSASNTRCVEEARLSCKRPCVRGASMCFKDKLANRSFHVAHDAMTAQSRTPKSFFEGAGSYFVPSCIRQPSKPKTLSPKGHCRGRSGRSATGSSRPRCIKQSETLS